MDRELEHHKKDTRDLVRFYSLAVGTVVAGALLGTLIVLAFPT